MNNHKITYDPEKNPCCGNCKKFENENSDGWGWCKEFQEKSVCWAYCERWDDVDEK
jgi:hypothetical protein